jgi:hypothetical protein
MFACFWLRERRWAVAVAISAFVVRLALHSVYLHERLRHRWRMPWDHADEIT